MDAKLRMVLDVGEPAPYPSLPMTHETPTTEETARTWADIDLDRIVANVGTLRAQLPVAAEILMPVKANAYGHGLVPVAAVAKSAGVWGLGVASLDEAATLRTADISGPVVCLMPILPGEAERAIALEVTAAITDWPQVEALAAAAAAGGRTTPVHVEVDTGMGRSGAWDRDAIELIESAHKLPSIEVEGIFTHFASADERGRAPTERQLDRFDAMLDELAERGIRPPWIHAANSAAALRFRRATRTLVRPGIVVYGSAEEIAPDTDFESGNDDRAFDAQAFEPALSWHARVTAVKSLAAGESVSYHRRYIAHGPERIAVLGVGYGDGWPFSLSDRGHVLLRGRRVPIRGVVCMDLTMVDATLFPDLEVGEIATLIGRQGDEIQTVAAVGREASLMSYAVFTGISQRVRRCYKPGVTR
jgi:alanine racemase